MVQGKYKYSGTNAPSAQLVKYYLRIVVAEVLTSTLGNSLGTARGIGTFLRLLDGKSPSLDEAKLVHSLLLNIQTGAYDEDLFHWSKLGATKVSVEGGSGAKYLESVLKPMMGNCVFIEFMICSETMKS